MAEGLLERVSALENETGLSAPITTKGIDFPIVRPSTAPGIPKADVSSRVVTQETITSTLSNDIIALTGRVGYLETSLGISKPAITKRAGP